MLMTLISACNGSNIKKGDTDFPELNSNANQVLNIYGLIDENIQIRFAIRWITTKGKSWPVADGNCNFYTNRFEGAAGGYSFETPITPQILNGRYELRIATDAYQPGRCGWEFSGLLVYVAGQQFDSLFSIDSAELLVEPNTILPNWSGMITSTKNSLNVSCTAINTTPPETGRAGVFMKCVDTNTGKKIRAKLQNNTSGDFEFNIQKDKSAN